MGRQIFGSAAGAARTFGSLGKLGKAVAHGVVGGAFSAIRGGSFKSGFLAAGFSSAAGGIYKTDNVWKGAAFHAAVGGGGSVLGGGKFADGAVTGAFTYLFNDLAGDMGKRRLAGRRIKIQGAYEGVSAPTAVGRGISAIQVLASEPYEALTYISGQLQWRPKD